MILRCEAGVTKLEERGWEGEVLWGENIVK